MDKFAYLKYSLAFILLFVGIKMTLHSYMKTNMIDLPEWVSLSVIVVSLAVGIIYSFYKKPKLEN